MADDTPSPAALLLAQQIIHASAGNPARAKAAAVLVHAFAREAVERERERCVRVAESEPEMPGTPPRAVIDVCLAEPVEAMRVVCRVTKREIARRIRAGETP